MNFLLVTATVLTAYSSLPVIAAEYSSRAAPIDVVFEMESNVDGNAGPDTVIAAPLALAVQVAPEPRLVRVASNNRKSTRAVQRQLRRVGCYRGAIDGVWGPLSQQAARRFNHRTTGANISTTNPGQRAVGVVHSVRTRVCS